MPVFLPGKETTLTVGTLYVVSAPAGHPDDLSLRAKRTLGEVSLIISEYSSLQALLAHHKIAVPFVWLSNLDSQQGADRIIDALEGADVALLCMGAHAGSTRFGQMAIRAALERDLPVIPIPGPSLPLTALVASGVPSDSFVYLGQLPHETMERKELLTSIAAERRTLVALVTPEHVFGTLVQMRAVLGDRPLAVTSSGESPAATWRGTLAGLLARQSDWPSEATLGLVVGGSREERTRWDEGRLRVEIQACMDQGMGAKETSRRLTVESGWSRRDIYRLVIGGGKVSASE